MLHPCCQPFPSSGRCPQNLISNCQLNYPMTSIPIERAVPAIVLNADSSDSAFRSGIFSLAMSSTCFFVTVPTLFLFGSFDPFARFAARFSRIDAGGVLVMKLYDRSA